MTDQTVIIQSYSRQAIGQIEEAFRNAAGGNGAAAGGGGGGGRGDNTNAVTQNTTAFQKATTATKKFTGYLSDTMDSIRNLTGNRGIGMLMDEFRSGITGGVQALDGSMEAFSDAGSLQSAIAKALDGDFSELQDGLKGASTGFKAYADRTAKTFQMLGVSIKELNEFNKTSRIASINMGGFSQWQDKLASQQSKYFDRIGDHVEAMKHQTEMMNLLTYSGGKASDLYGEFGKRLDRTNDDLLKMGITYEESRDYLKGMVKEDEVRTRLMSAADKKRRLQILLEIQDRYKNLKAMGMSTEQAEAASKALEKLSGKGPLDRIKEAAKMQAGMAALGIENAQEVANIYRKGDRATEQERQTMAKALGQFQTLAKESRTQGLGKELSVSMIAMKTGLDKLPDVFATKLGEAGGKITQAQRDNIKIMGKNTENLAGVASALDKLSAVMEKSWVPEVPGMIKDVGTFALKAGAAVAALKVGSDVAEKGVIGALKGYFTTQEEQERAAAQQRDDAIKATQETAQKIGDVNVTLATLNERLATDTEQQRMTDQQSIQILKETLAKLEEQLKMQGKVVANTKPQVIGKGKGKNK